MSIDAETRILDVSLELFGHFGFKKTTMGEIAQRAGVSRPTLYARYDSKEQVFAAVVDCYMRRLASEVDEATEHVSALHDKLEVAFEVSIVRPFEKSRGHAFKQEILNLDDERINQSLASAHDTFDRLFTRLIKESDIDLKALGTTAPRFARLLNASARGFKEHARDSKELRQLLSGLVNFGARCHHRRCSMKVLIFGATGMIGYGVLLECLDDPSIESVTAVGRRPVELEHDKLEQITHSDFTDFSSIGERLSGFDACMWCLGVSAAGMSEEKYRQITLEFTVAAAEVLADKNPGMTFCFVSGAGTDRQSGQMWARVKAEAEDRLAEFPFKAHYNFRPAMIQPKRGARSTITSYRVLYAILNPFYPLLKRWKTFVTSTPEVGHAMIRAARSGAPKHTLENIDICALAAGATPEPPVAEVRR